MSDQYEYCIKLLDASKYDKQLNAMGLQGWMLVHMQNLGCGTFRAILMRKIEEIQ